MWQYSFICKRGEYLRDKMDSGSVRGHGGKPDDMKNEGGAGVRLRCDLEIVFASSGVRLAGPSASQPSAATPPPTRNRGNADLASAVATGFASSSAVGSSRDRLRLSPADRAGRAPEDFPRRRRRPPARSRLPRGLRISAFVAAFVMVALVFQAPQAAASTATTLSGSNAALAAMGASASASSSAAGFEVGKAIDGSTSTYWASATGTATLTVAFLALYNIGEVHVHMAGVAQPDLDVKVDPDGTETNWVLVKSVRGNTAMDVIGTFSLMAAKKVRVDFLTTVTHTHTTTTQVWVCDVWDYDEATRHRYCSAGHYETQTTTYTETHPPQVAELEAWGNPNQDTDADGLANAFEETTWYRQDALVDGLPKAIPNNGTDVLVMTLERPKWAGIATRAFLDLEVDHGSPGDLVVAVGSWDGTAWRYKTVWTPGTFANASIWDTVVITHTHTGTRTVCNRQFDYDTGTYYCVYTTQTYSYTENHVYPSKSVSAGTGERLALTSGFGSTASASNASSTIWHVTIDLMKASLDSWETSAGFRASAWTAADLHAQGSWRVLVRDWNPFATGGTLRSASIRTEERSDPLRADTDGEIADGNELKIGAFPVALDTDFDGLSDLFESNPQSLTLTINGVTSTRTVKTDPAKADTDGDGLSDGEERTLGADRTVTDPTVPDTDGDGLWDGYTTGGHLGELSYNTNATRTDTDGDTFSDWTEINARSLALTINGAAVTRSVTTLPYSADSDGDGLKDNEEWYGTSVYGVVTDPSDPDTDHDGLADGQERYMKEVAMPTRRSAGTSVSVPLSVRIAGAVEKATVSYGLSTIDVSNFYVTLAQGSNSVVVRNHQGSGLVNFSSVDLPASMQGGGMYTLSVSSSASGGILEKFSVLFTIRTSPVKADTDGDSLNDSEETTFGQDGWITDPQLPDTDGDSWNDAYEISRGTNPLSVDTDGDGARDNVDLDPLRNLVVRVTVNKIHHGASPWCTPELVGIVRVNDAYTWVTEHHMATEDGYFSFGCMADIKSTGVFGLTYYADVPDDVASANVRMTGWSVNPSRGDDNLVDQSLTYSLNSAIPTQTFSNGNSWITFDVSTVGLAKAKTLLITDGNATVTSAAGVTRMAGQDRFFVFALNVTAASSPFVVGINTILVPRAIFLDTKLKADFSAGSYAPLSDAPVYGDDLAKAEISDGVAGVVAASLTAAQAADVLNRLLRNASGGLTHSYIDLTSQALVANLPADVVKILPWQAVTNGPTGTMPSDFWSKIGAVASTVVNNLVQFGQLVYRGLVALGTFLVNLGEAIWDWGMKALGAVWNAVVSVAQTAASLLNRLVDAAADLMIRTLQGAIRAILDGFTALYRATIGPVVSDLISLVENPDPFRTANIIASLVTRLMELALMIALVPIAIRAAEVALAAATLGVGYLVTKFSAKVVAEFAVKTLLATALSLAIATLFGEVLESVDWVQQGVVELLKSVGLAVSYSAAASSIVLKFYKAMHDSAAGRRSPLLRWIGFGFGVLGLGLLFLGTSGLRGVPLFLVDIAGMFLATGGFCLYVYESAKGEQRAADLLSSIGVYFEKFVAYGSPFVATAKAIDHGSQGLFG